MEDVYASPVRMSDGKTSVADVGGDRDRAAPRQRNDHGVLNACEEVTVVRPPLQRVGSDTRHSKTEAAGLDLLRAIDAVDRKGREPPRRFPSEITLRQLGRPYEHAGGRVDDQVWVVQRGIARVRGGSRLREQAGLC